jgi:hypothetical protein
MAVNVARALGLDVMRCVTVLGRRSWREGLVPGRERHSSSVRGSLTARRVWHDGRDRNHTQVQDHHSLYGIIDLPVPRQIGVYVSMGKFWANSGVQG